MGAALIPGSSPSPAEPASNRRRHERVDFRTAVVALIDGPDGFRRLRCQTNNVSYEGAQLISCEPLPGPLVVLRILMPGLAERFVEAEVVNELVQSEHRIGVGRASRYMYGVRFRRIVSDEAVLERLRLAVAPPTSGAAGS